MPLYPRIVQDMLDSVGGRIRGTWYADMEYIPRKADSAFHHMRKVVN